MPKRLLQIQNKEGDKKAETRQDDTFQAFAVLGIALVAMGEDIGAEMSLRQFNHLVCTILFLESHHLTKPTVDALR
jgi:hypothetical protein